MTLGGVSIVPLIVFAVTIFLVFKHPMVRIPFTRKYFHIDYGWAVIIGVIVLLLVFPLSIDTISRGVFGAENVTPYAIVILIISLAYICISIDFTGFFEYLSLKVVRASKGFGRRLFVYVFLLACALSLFTDNDIVVLTMTPIIFYLAKYAKLNPIPYLIGEFFAANLFGMTLYIGGPPNIIAADAMGITFIEFAKWMILPSVVAAISCLSLLWLVFRKQVPKKFKVPNIDAKTALKDRKGAIIGMTILALTVILMSLPYSVTGLHLWVIALLSAAAMFTRDFFAYHVFASKQDRSASNSKLKTIASRVPWKAIPFVIGLFIMIEALAYAGWTDLLASHLMNYSGNIFTMVISVALFSSFATNLMNNTPMTIFFVRGFQSSSFAVAPATKLGSTFALVIGSNIGANLTLIGALAGVIWVKILEDKGVTISFSQFSKYGLLIMIPVLILTCLPLIAEIILWL